VARVRIGYFEGFKDGDTVLIDGDNEGLGELARMLTVLIAGNPDALAIHSLPFVEAANGVQVHAHRVRRDLGMQRAANGFLWRHTSRAWAGVVEQILGVQEHGKCHQYLDAPSNDVTVMVSSGEYGEPWPKWGPPPWAK
jgi:hypothetical protein